MQAQKITEESATTLIKKCYKDIGEDPAEIIVCAKSFDWATSYDGFRAVRQKYYEYRDISYTAVSDKDCESIKLMLREQWTKVPP